MRKKHASQYANFGWLRCVALGYADSKIPMKEKKVKDGTITIVK